uniref:Putative lipocalin n=1 Tax=Ixodes ricinus TaxID=34613 RepID=A0A6B0VD31_IXORI
MSLLNVIYLCIALLISPYYTNSFPDVPIKYVTSECREKAKQFVVPNVPLAYDSALFCMYQNLEVLKEMQSLHLALTTPHTGRSICRIDVHWFNKTAKTVNMTIYDTDLQGTCTQRNSTDIVEAVQDYRTQELSELIIRRKIGRRHISFQKERTRLLFTDYNKCLIFITPLNHLKYCELFVKSSSEINMHNTPCHPIYRLYCGYGRKTRDVFPNPVNSSSDEDYLREAHKLRLLLEQRDPLKEDTIFMNEYQMTPEVLYNIPVSILYASTDGVDNRLCEIYVYQIFPDFADLEVRGVFNRKKFTVPLWSYYSKDANAFSPTRISLLDQQAGTHPNNRRVRRVLLSDFQKCYVLKSLKDQTRTPLCEFFVKNNTDISTGLDECWFTFLAYCGYPKATYKTKNCYSLD